VTPVRPEPAGKPCRSVGHGDYPVPGCHLCMLAVTDGRSARAWGEPWPPPPDRVPAGFAPTVLVTVPVAEPPPCVHRGDELTGRERAARGLDHARHWAFCGHPGRPLGEAACPCHGCGPGCPGYAPAA